MRPLFVWWWGTRRAETRSHSPELGTGAVWPGPAPERPRGMRPSNALQSRAKCCYRDLNILNRPV